jgi:imidazole glycerol-phosphate synthase subunit HisH
MPRSVAIVDYGMGNLRSLGRALERAGAEVIVTDDPKAIAGAERIVIPGQGAFGRAMERIDARGMRSVLVEAIAEKRPILGVCLGLQILYDGSEEAPGVAGLGILGGTVERMAIRAGLKRPHMGWSPVEHASDHPVFAANPSGEAFYFVHSYAARAAPGAATALACHADPFVAAIAKDTLVATQFHPEKSQDAGARLLAAWLAL